MVGQVVESTPPKRLVLSWAEPATPTDDSRVMFEIDAIGDMVRLNIIHGNFKASSTLPSKISMGWPLVLSNLKSLLETGKAFDVMELKTALKLGCSTDNAA